MDVDVPSRRTLVAWSPSPQRVEHPRPYYAGMADACVLAGIINVMGGLGTFALYFLNYQEAYLFLLPVLVAPLVASWMLRRFFTPYNVRGSPPARTATFTAPARKGT